MPLLVAARVVGIGAVVDGARTLLIPGATIIRLVLTLLLEPWQRLGVFLRRRRCIDGI